MEGETESRRGKRSAQEREIGPLPQPDDPERKENCRKDFRRFCETYFPRNFCLAWSEDHLKVIRRIENAVLEGGLYALAMPRGSGKSTLTECAALWAMLYGHRHFIVLVGATESAAQEMMDSMKTELEVNEFLERDFPEVCVPVNALEGISSRCAGQLCDGERTRMEWTNKLISLPVVNGSSASGVIVRVTGITGRIRGMRRKRADGGTMRPDLVIIDDPQTSESANSPEQSKKRVRVLSGDILGLAGPGEKISGIMPCTIIRPGDMADTILDQERYPDWNGEKTKMVYAFPTHMELWEKYRDIRRESLRIHGDGREATEFYEQHRAAMDEGARVGWQARYNPDEISALQHAMNLKYRDEAAFMAEYQNEPLLPFAPDDALPDPEDIACKCNGLKRETVPLSCSHVTAFIDIQKTLLYYTVQAWSDDFTGAVIDYGAWPEQKCADFHLYNASPVIQDIFPEAGLEGCIYAALEKLTDGLLGREWRREDGMELRIERAMIDANWGASTDIVYQFCRQSRWGAILYPQHGRFVGAGSVPMTEYRRQPGMRIGFNWVIPAGTGKRAVRHVLFDTNYWKSFLHARLAVPVGDRGSLTLFGRNPELHRNLQDHLTAEYRVRTSGRGRSVDEWKLRPDRKDNHWLDCLTGCAVCGSLQGCSLPELADAAVSCGGKPRIRLSELQMRKSV